MRSMGRLKGVASMTTRSPRSIFADDERLEKGLQKFTLKLVTPATEKIGWEFNTNEDFLTGQLRALLLSTAGGAGHQGLVMAYYLSC